MDNRTKKISMLVVLGLILALMVTYFTYYVNTKAPLPSPGSVVKPSFLKSVYEPMRNPAGVAVDNDAKQVYVADAGSQSIHVLDLAGTNKFEIKYIDKKDKKKTLVAPVYCAVSNKGELYVSDRSLAGIYIFNSKGEFVKEFFPNNDSKFSWAPLGITIDKNGRIYFADVGQEHRVVVCKPDGKVDFTIGKTGYVQKVADKPGSFYFPNKIVVDDEGYIYVTDGNNRRIQVFDKKGKFHKVLMSGGALKGLSLDEEQNLIYVPDVFNCTVDVFDLAGKKIYAFAEPGSGNGQLNFPSDVALSDSGQVYIVDQGNNRLQIWKKPIQSNDIFRQAAAFAPYFAIAIAALAVAFVAIWKYLSPGLGKK
ncbi:MAG: hypothetical protein C4562_03625 [Actinobacteria bacterium]|nr:MAG: hypothetical protein C4562_03625 [Actinomycetota bacterium]